MLNTKKLQNLIDTGTITKATICKIANIGRPTLDAILKGSDARISTIELIAQALKVKIGYLFDEEVIIEDKHVEKYEANGQMSTSARTIGKVVNRGSTAVPMIDSASGTDDKDRKIQELKDKLLEAQTEIITLQKRLLQQ